jgi:hypothetical protein
MKYNTLALKKAFLIGTALLTLSSTTAFAFGGGGGMGGPPPGGMNQASQESAIYRDSETTPCQTLAKILDMDADDIIEEAQKDYFDAYEFAAKKGVLAKYKAERLIIAEDNIQKAIDNGKVSPEVGKKVLAKVQANINNEKAESAGIMPMIKSVQRQQRR